MSVSLGEPPPSPSSTPPELSADDSLSTAGGGSGSLSSFGSSLESAGTTTVATIPVVAAAAVTPMATTVVTAAALAATIRPTTRAPWRRAPSLPPAAARRCRGRSASPAPLLSVLVRRSRMVACIRATMSGSSANSSSGAGSRMAACMRATMSDSPANSSSVAGAAASRIRVATRPYQAGASSVSADPAQTRWACWASNRALSIQRSSGVIRPAPPRSPSRDRRSGWPTVGARDGTSPARHRGCAP